MPKPEMSNYSIVIELCGKRNVSNYVQAGWELISTYAGLAPLGKGQTTLTYRLGWLYGRGRPVRPEIDERELEQGPSAN